MDEVWKFLPRLKTDISFSVSSGSITEYAFACAAAFTLSALRTIKGDLAAYVRPLSDPKFLICVVVLSLFCSILCNNMVNYAAGKMSVVKLSSLGSLTTLCSMFAGVVLLHEPLTPALLLGSVLILAGIRQVTKQQ